MTQYPQTNSPLKGLGFLGITSYNIVTWALCIGFRVQGLGFRVQVQGLGFRVKGLGFISMSSYGIVPLKQREDVEGIQIKPLSPASSRKTLNPNSTFSRGGPAASHRILQLTPFHGVSFAF